MVALEILTKRSIRKCQDHNNQISNNEKLNERITEDIVREHFKSDNLYNKIKIEEQKSNIETIQELLKNASKKGTGIGKPKFIISFLEILDSVIIIECKSDVKNHESKKMNLQILKNMQWTVFCIIQNLSKRSLM